MSSSDKQISAALAIIILIHIAIPVMGLANASCFYLVAYLNLAVSLSLLLYWLQKQIRIQQHFIELREVVVLGFEAAVVGCSAYALIKEPLRWLRVTHFVFSGIHLLAFIAFFIFMFLFKIKKLF